MLSYNAIVAIDQVRDADKADLACLLVTGATSREYRERKEAEYRMALRDAKVAIARLNTAELAEVIDMCGRGAVEHCLPEGVDLPDA